MDKKTETSYSLEQIIDCIPVLEYLAQNSGVLEDLSREQKIALLTACGQISRPDRRERKKRQKQKKELRRRQLAEHNRSARTTTGIRQARTVAVYTAPAQISDLQGAKSEKKLDPPQKCYVCNAEYDRLHFFYDAMCPVCGDFNYSKRFQTASLHGRVALITGARLKIGYQATLMMLRAGAVVIATTRFPVDAAMRFSSEEDFGEWQDRLQIYGLDLRHTPSVEIFASYIEQQYQRLDILINNAAQTVRRPPGFYAHLLANEKQEFAKLPEDIRIVLDRHEACKQHLQSLGDTNTLTTSSLAVSWHRQMPGIGLLESAQLSQIPYSYDDTVAPTEIFPEGQLDADLQQVDLRKTNSWRLRLGEIETPEMLEVQLVNAVAPFVLCNRLAPLMKRNYTGESHIVNVTAMEGKFFRFKKDDRHPHTNMAKAALNMLTHTSASDLAKAGIFMNAVDTGWVTDEDPVELSLHKQDLHDFQPPLDIVDGAARICDPFFDGILTGKHWCGKFLKDYRPIDW